MRVEDGFAWWWPYGASACAAAVALSALVSDRLVGSTAVLALAVGLLLVPLLPRDRWSPSIVLAALPALSLGGFAVVALSLSTVGITLTRLSMSLFVITAAIVAAFVSLRRPQPGGTDEPRRWRWREEIVVVAGLAGIAALSVALSQLVLRGGFPPVGTDWGHYFLYATEVREHGRLYIENPYWMGGGRPFPNDPGAGALLGSLMRFDGLGEQSLTQVIAVLFALMPLSTFAAVATLWGRAAGLVAALALAVATQLREILPWHGIALIFALVVFPFLLLAIGRAYRGHRDWATKGLLAFVLVATAVVHRASAVLVGTIVLTVLLLRVWRGLYAQEPAAAAAASGGRGRWRDDAVRVVIVQGCLIAAVAGSLVLVHLARQAQALGRPPGVKYFQTRLDLETITNAYGRWLLGLAVLAVILIVVRRRQLADPALAALGALTVGIVATSLLFMVGVAWDYARAAYYLAVPLAALIGVGAALLPRHAWPVVCVPLLALGIAPLGDGPEGQNWRTVDAAGVVALRALSADLRTSKPGRPPAIVTDTCYAFLSQYLVRAPMYGAIPEFLTVAGKDLAPAQDARTILRGGKQGAARARELGVEYAVLNPAICGTPKLRGETVYSSSLLRIQRLDTAAAG